MEDWEWKMNGEIAKVLEVFKGYGNDIFMPEATKALIRVFRKYAPNLKEEE